MRCCWSLCRTRFPWNQQKLSGYVAEKCLDLLIGGTYFLALAAVLLLFTSLCLHHRTFLKMFKYVLAKIGKSNHNGLDTETVCDLIRFHTKIKEWVFDWIWPLGLSRAGYFIYIQQITAYSWIRQTFTVHLYSLNWFAACFIWRALHFNWIWYIFQTISSSSSNR